LNPAKAQQLLPKVSNEVPPSSQGNQILLPNPSENQTGSSQTFVNLSENSVPLLSKPIVSTGLSQVSKK